MVAPSGEQYEIPGGGYRAVVTEGGAGLRLLEHDGRPLVDGFGEDAPPPAGRGQLLMPLAQPDPRRQLRLRRHAPCSWGSPSRPGQRLHGLARWAAWTRRGAHRDSVSLRYRLMAQTGYPWTLDLHVLYDLSADGLTSPRPRPTWSAEPAPYAAGAHPYLSVGDGRSTAGELLCRRPPAWSTTGCPTDEPSSTARLRLPGAPPRRRPSLDDAFTDLPATTTAARGASSGTRPTARGWRCGWTPRTGGCRSSPPTTRTGDPPASLAVEPMTAPADAFNSGGTCVVLAAAGERRRVLGVLGHAGR